MDKNDAFPDFDDAIPPANARPRPKLRLADVAEEAGYIIPVNLSEDHLADHFAMLNQDRWRWVDAWKGWFLWDENEGWRREVTRLAEQEIREFVRGACHWSDAEKMTWEARKKLGSMRTSFNVRTFVQTDRRITATTEQWDTDDNLLGVPGGVVDLDTGKLYKPRQQDYISKRCAVRPERGALVEWDRFLDFFTSSSAPKREYIHRLCGMCLSGNRTEQSFTFLFGNGGNGKGVFLKVLMDIMGDYAAGVDANSFMAQKFGEGGTSDIARLHNVRLAVVDETPKGCVFNEKRIQAVTGGGRLTARLLHQNFFEFLPKFRLIMAGNYKPMIRSTGQAMRRRLHMFPALGKIAIDKQDRELSTKLAAEYPAILAWMMEGYKLWVAEGLKPPMEMIAATESYLESEDTVSDWIEDRCKQTVGHRVNRVEAYKDYKSWCSAQGKEHCMSDRMFYEDLETKGFQPGRAASMRFFVGLEMLPKVFEPPRWADRD